MTKIVSQQLHFLSCHSRTCVLDTSLHLCPATPSPSPCLAVPHHWLHSHRAHVLAPACTTPMPLPCPCACCLPVRPCCTYAADMVCILFLLFFLGGKLTSPPLHVFCMSSPCPLPPRLDVSIVPTPCHASITSTSLTNFSFFPFSLTLMYFYFQSFTFCSFMYFMTCNKLVFQLNYHRFDLSNMLENNSLSSTA